MVKKNDDDIIEHYDLKYNTDKQGFIAITFILLISLFMLIHFFYIPSNSQCVSDNVNFYLMIGSGVIILISILLSISFAFNNTID